MQLPQKGTRPERGWRRTRQSIEIEWSRQSLLFLTQAISHGADGVNKTLLTRSVNFCSEQSNKDIEVVVFNLAIVAPDLISQIVPCDHLSGCPHKTLKKSKLGRR